MIFHCVDGNIQHLGNFPVFHLVDVTQHKHFTASFGQTINGLTHVTLEIAHEQLLHRFVLIRVQSVAFYFSNLLLELTALHPFRHLMFDLIQASLVDRFEQVGFQRSVYR